MRFLSPNGLPIVGTLETLKARAEATEYSATGEPEYSGETDVWWDEQKTVTKGNSLVYLDEDGYEWVFPDLVPEDEDEEAAA